MIRRREFCYFLFILFALGMSSCIVHSPMYSTLDKVLELKEGMTKDEVSKILGIPPYNFISLTDSGECTLLYKYRVKDRATIPFFTSGANGKPVKGKYVNLKVTYDKTGKLICMESCTECDETIIREKKVDIDKVITFLSVTVPAVLVYLGIQATF